nr:retrotransposon-related protein [Tanacetum cinerariifolium]
IYIRTQTLTTMRAVVDKTNNPWRRAFLIACHRGTVGQSDYGYGSSKGAKPTKLFFAPKVAGNASKPLSIKWISPMEWQERLSDSPRTRFGYKGIPVCLTHAGSRRGLGIQWLQQLGKVTHDYAQQVMKFTILDTTYTLKGDESLCMKKISLHRMQALLETDKEYGVYEWHDFAM